MKRTSLKVCAIVAIAIMGLSSKSFATGGTTPRRDLGTADFIKAGNTTNHVTGSQH